VITGYLIGLVATQWLIAVVAGKAMEVLWQVVKSDAIEARLAGGIVAGVGAFLVLETAEAATFAVLGLG
jgi:urease accessory protein